LAPLARAARRDFARASLASPLTDAPETCDAA
jgi:hypothetical protein